MQLDIQSFILIIFLGATMLTALFVAVVLVMRKKGNRLSNRLLSLYLILSALTILDNFFGLSGISNQYPFLYFIPLVYTFSFGPLFYLFVKTKMNNSHQLAKLDYLHFILPLAQFLFYLAIGFQSVEFKSWIWRAVYGPVVQYIEEGVFPILSLIYIYAAYQLAKRKEGKDWMQRTHKWIRKFALVFGVLIAVVAFYTILEWVMWIGYEINIYNIPYLAIPLQLSMFLTTLWVTANAWLYSHQSLILKSKVQTNNSSSGIWSKIKEQFEVEKIYLNHDLDLNMLAALTGESRNKLSALFSENKTGFNDYVNDYRVKAFEAIVSSEKGSLFSVEGASYEVGFNSRSTFYRAFKKRHDISPAQYVKGIKG